MNVVGYVRLSRDEDKENYSSITSQQDIINEYAAGKGWTVSKVYIDDNCSGYTLDRPEYNRMIEEVEQGNIDTILTKDLSRIGRNNGKVLVLIDKLRELNIRLILITEGNGGLDLLEDEHDILGIKTWYNEMYIKDISRKIRANMHSKQKKGELIMGNFFGYNKVKINDKFHLMIDEHVMPIIQLIFKLYIAGLGYKKICDILDEKGYVTPSEYIKQRHENKGRVFKNATTSKWQTHMIQRIIQNEVYVGTLRTRKRHSRFIKGKQEKVAKEEQYVFENNHDPIISKEDFRLAQEIKLKRNESPYRANKAKYEYIFGSFIECGHCGYAVIGLNLRKAPAIKKGYNCTMYQKYGNSQCWNHSVEEEKILFYFKELLKDLKAEFEEYIANVETVERKNYIKSSLENLQRELNIAKEDLKLTLNQKIKDLRKESNAEYREIIEKGYEDVEMDKKKKIADLTQRIKELNRAANIDNEKTIKTNIEIFDHIIHAEIPERKDLELIIDKIVVYAEKSSRNRNFDFKLKIDIDKLTYADMK
ncbi:MAG TPA: recombinase family protein [Patescibacteria group bacterium]|nr:recombinase family protein [Patescibacteria group bacterium]